MVFEEKSVSSAVPHSHTSTPLVYAEQSFPSTSVVLPSRSEQGGEGGDGGGGGGESGRIGGPSGCNGGGGEHGGGNVDPQAQQLSSGWLYPAGLYDVSSAHSIPGQAPWPWPQHQPSLT